MLTGTGTRCPWMRCGWLSAALTRPLRPSSPAALIRGALTANRSPPRRATVSCGRTWERRPELLAGRVLNSEERALLDEYREEHES